MTGFFVKFDILQLAQLNSWQLPIMLHKIIKIETQRDKKIFNLAKPCLYVALFYNKNGTMMMKKKKMQRIFIFKP